MARWGAPACPAISTSPKCVQRARSPPHRPTNSRDRRLSGKPLQPRKALPETPTFPTGTPGPGHGPCAHRWDVPSGPTGTPQRPRAGRPLRRKSFRVGGKGCFEPAVLRSHGGTTDPTRQALPSACMGAAVLPGPHEGGGRCRRGWLPGCLIAAWPGDAVEAFAWYNRPLQHSPGILP